MASRRVTAAASFLLVLALLGALTRAGDLRSATRRAYLFPCFKNNGEYGLHLAYSRDDRREQVGPGFSPDSEHLGQDVRADAGTLSVQEPVRAEARILLFSDRTFLLQ